MKRPITEVLVERLGHSEHRVRRLDLVDPPGADRVVKGRRASEHAIEVRNGPHAPVADRLVKGFGPIEHTVHAPDPVDPPAADWSIKYDSNAPKNSDPWPASIQFAVSRVPCQFTINEAGTPEDILAIDQWKESAWLSVKELGLPDVAKKSVHAMVEPQSMLRGIVRDFPGTPPKKDMWERTIQIAGLSVAVKQSCQFQRDKQLRIWQCKGTLPQGGTQKGQVLDVNMLTVITADRHGLIEHTFSYDGVLVRASTSGALSHHAIAGKRKVKRVAAAQGVPLDNPQPVPQ